MAEGTDVGTAWISVVPSFRGMKTAISQELGGVDTTVFSRPLSSAVKNAANGAIKTIGGAAEKIGKIGLGTLAGGVAAVGASFAALVPEAIAASDATDKFKQTLKFAGLGTEQIETLTKATRDYANRTVYDLADIQNITAQLAANGVPNFDKLAEAAGNLNAVAGGNKETFRSVGMVLTQTAGAGKLTTENWNQLADAIPGASGRLQDAMRKNSAYTGNFRDALEKGQISAEEFNQAIKDLGFEDVAVKAASSTATFEGAWGNLQASVVDGMGQILDKFKGPLTDIMGALAEQLGPAFDATSAKVQPLVDWMTRLAQAMKDGSLTIGDLSGKLVAASGGFAALWGGGAAMGNWSAISDGLGVLDAIPGRLQNTVGKATSAAKGLSQTLGSITEDIKVRAMYAGDAFGGVGNNIATKLSSIKGTISGKLNGVADVVTAPLKTAGNKVGTALTGVGQAVSGKLSSVTAPLSALGGKVSTALSPLSTAFEGVGGTLASGAQGALGKVGGAFTSFFSPGNFLKFLGLGALVGALVAGLGTLVSSGGGELMAQISGLISELPGQIMGALSNINAQLPQIMQMGTTLLLAITNAITANLPQLLTAAAAIISNLVTGLASALPQLIPASVQMITTLLTGLITQLPTLLQAGLNLLMGLVQGIINALPVLIAAIPQVISALVNALVTMLPMIIAAGIELLNSLINGIVAAIPQLIAMLPTIITTVVEGIVNALPMIIDAGIQLLVALITGVLNALPQLIATVPTLILTIVQILGNNMPTILSAGVTILVSLVTGIGKALPQLWNVIKGLPGKIVETLGNLGSMLIGSGRSLINGFVDGIKNAFNAAKDAVKNGLSAIRNFFPFSPAKEGPFSGKGWVLYSGLSIGEAMSEGIRRSSSETLAAVDELTSAAQARLDAANLQRGVLLSGAMASQMAATSGAANQSIVIRELVVRDVNNQLVGRMQVEAQHVVDESTAPASRSRARELMGV